MPTLTDSLTASSARRLPFRKRPDLEVSRQVYEGRSYWIVKEPIGLTYHRFLEEEYQLLEMLDGTPSLDDLKQQFEARFRPQTIAREELQQFLGMLHRSGLVIADVTGQGEQLERRATKRRRQERWAAATNPLSIRFKGFDPEALLNRLYPSTRWFFSTPAVVCCLAMMFAALLLIAVQFDTFQAKLPAFEDFFAAQHWIWLALALSVSKVLHEFGHALCCKHYRGECHEMGVLFLVFTPCLYVNVSDAWLLPNKWHRIAIGAAGMYVELVLASICTFLWWMSEPGLLNYLCLSTMFVASVSTLLFNSNPLLRFDGYYMLSDLLEIPNLRQKASTLLHRKAGRWLLGLREPPDPFLPHRHQGLFACYSVAAACYRWFVTFAILWFLHQVFKPYRLELIGQLIGAVALYGLLVRPLWQLGKFFYQPGRLRQVKRTRLITSVTLVAIVMVAVALIPMPAAVYCPLEIQPRQATAVYVDVPGRLAMVHVTPGVEVRRGQPLAQLANWDVDLAIERLRGERDALASRLAGLEQQRFRQREASLEIQHVRESLAATEAQLTEKQRDARRLQLVAPVAGIVLPPPAVAEQAKSEDELANWFGTPLDRVNRGATLGESTMLCRIGNPRQLEAVLVIDQADIVRVQSEQAVEIQFQQLPGATYRGTIVDVARRELEISSQRLSSKAGGELATHTGADGHEQPLSTSYQALVPLDDVEGILRPGLVGHAKVHTAWETLGARVCRYLARTFRFEL